MSIIQTIRDKGSWIMVILIVLAIISFIFMDARSSLFGGNSNPTLGTVNGSKIKQDEFVNRTNAFEYAYKGNAQATPEAINRAVWQMMTDEKLMADEFAQFDDNIDTKTLGEMAIGKYGMPSQYMVQLFKNSFGEQMLNERGQLNPQQAELALKQMRSLQSTNDDAKKFMNAYEAMLNMVRYEYVSNKYNLVMQTTNYVPKWLTTKKLAEDNQLTNISFVNYPYGDVNDSTVAEVKVSDDDIKNYVAKYPSRFKVNESRDIDYILFDYNPTGLDSAKLSASLEESKAKLATKNDTTVAAFVNNAGSMYPYNEQYTRRKEVLMTDSNAVLTEGATYGPYIKDGNYVVAKVLKVKNYADSASARHILIKVNDPQQRKVVREDAEARKLMDSVVALYRSGVSFDSLAKRFSEDPGSKDSGGLYKNFPLNQMVPAFNDFAFGKNVGDTGVIKTDFGYHFIKAEGTKGTAKASYKIAYIAKPIVPTTQTKDSVLGAANTFAGNNRTGKAFDDYFTKNPAAVRMNGYGIEREQLNIAGINPTNTKALARWAFEAKPNTVSEPFDLDGMNKYAVAKLVRAQPEGTKDVATIRKDPMVMGQIAQDKKYTYLAKKYGTPATIEEAATKLGKSIINVDSVSFANGAIPNYAPEPRVVGYAFNAAAQTKVSGPIKGTSGLFYVKATAAPYNSAKPNTDVKAYQKQLEQLFSGQQNPADAYKKNAKIKDSRLDKGF